MDSPIDLGPYVKLTATKQPVVIWSGEHRAWWGPNQSGYFTNPSSAGVYTLAEAMQATHHVGPEKQIRIEDAPEILSRLNDDLDKIEALVDWCRDHVRPPPSDLLYAAAGAVANMRHEAEAPAIGLYTPAIGLLRLILPLAKGYAAVHPFGGNQKYVDSVTQFLDGIDAPADTETTP